MDPANPQDGSHYVDPPEHAKENVELRREVDRLKGMLEQKHGWLRKGLVACGRFLTAPSRLIYILCDWRIVPTVLFHLAFVAMVAVSCNAFSIHRKEVAQQEAFSRELAEASQKSAVSFYQLVNYEGGQIGQPFPDQQLVFLCKNGSGERAGLVHVPAEFLGYFTQNIGHTFSIVELKHWLDSQEKAAEDEHLRKEKYQEELEQIRREAAEAGIPVESAEAK